MNIQTPAAGTKQIELRNGIAHRARMKVHETADGLHLDGDGMMRGATYRPTGLKTEDGIEIWTPQEWRIH